jgi:hypothetical protein
LRRRILHLMTPAEVAELAAQGVDFQMHTHRHRTPLDRDLFLREIRENRCRIRDITGATAAQFCYPCGSHQPEFLAWLKEADVCFATTCEPGLAAPDSEPLLLPRVVDHTSLSPIEFESCLAGLAFLLPGVGDRSGLPVDHLARLHASR